MFIIVESALSRQPVYLVYERTEGRQDVLRYGFRYRYDTEEMIALVTEREADRCANAS